jgi:hypothetical protein
MKKTNILLLMAGIILAFTACNRDEEIIHEEVIPVAPPDTIPQDTVPNDSLPNDSVMYKPCLIGFYFIE